MSKSKKKVKKPKKYVRPSRATGKPKGRPSKYEGKKSDAIAFNVSRLGAMETEIAKTLGVNIDTLYEWRKVHSSFTEAIKAGKAAADQRIQESLYTRAQGYSYEEEMDEESQSERTGKQTRKRTYKKHLAPDVTAQIFWLKNRQPEIWRDRRVLDANLTFTEEDKKKLADAFEEFANGE